MGRIWPNFLIVGSAKAGTTSLYHWLRYHPEVFMPEKKEPSYFVDGYGMSDLDAYLLLFAPGRGKKAIGEASTAYLASPESPQLISKQLGKVKTLILLRNPVERAFSLYCWMVMVGCEWLPTFEEAVKAEEKRCSDQFFRWHNPEYFWDYMYFRSGLYFEQVKRYTDTFGRDLVEIYLFDELKNDPGKLYGKVCNFLGIANNKRYASRSDIP